MESNYLTNVEQMAPNGVFPPFRTVECLESIKLEASTEETIDVYSTLLKIIDAVIANPHDASKRKLKFSNAALQRRIFKFPSAVRCLKSAFFIEREIEGEEKCLILETAYTLRLAEVSSHLNRMLETLGVKTTTNSSVFNPYKSSIQNMNPDQKHGLTVGNVKFDPIATQKAIDAREHLLISGGVSTDTPLPLNPTFGVAGYGKGVEEAMREITAADMEENPENVLAVLGKDGLENLKKSLAASGKFQSRRVQELEKLYKQKIFEKVMIRFQLPCNATIQMQFRPSVTAGYALNEVKKLLTQDAQNLISHIFTAPPFLKLDLNENLYSLGLHPCANVHVGLHSPKPDVWLNLSKQRKIFANPEVQSYLDAIRIEAEENMEIFRKKQEEERKREAEIIRQKIRESFDKNHGSNEDEDRERIPE